MTPAKGLNSNWFGFMGETWFQTIASASQLTCGEEKPDLDGVDFYVRAPRGAPTLWQIKATENFKWIDNDTRLSLSHPVAKVEALRDTAARSFVALFAIRSTFPKWIGYVGGPQNGGAVVRMSGYFLEINDSFQTPTGQTNMSLHFDRSNLITTTSLRSLVGA